LGRSVGGHHRRWIRLRLRRRVRRWLRRLRRVMAMSIWFSTSLPLRIAAIFAAWFSYGAVVSNLLTPEDNVRAAPIVWSVCLIAAAVSIASDAGVNRRFGSVEELRTYNVALKNGQLPEGADVVQWRHRIAQSRLAVALATTVLCPLLAFGWLASAYSQVAYHQLPLWTFGLAFIVVFAAAFRRSAHIRNLEPALKRGKASALPQGDRDRLRMQSETSLSVWFFSFVVVGSLFAFLLLILADLEPIVYDDNRATHLFWIAVAAVAVGVAATIIALSDPCLRVTAATIDDIRLYDHAFRTFELPEHFDVPLWRRWIRAHRRSNAVVLLWACFCLAVGCWSVLTHPSGYQWVVAILLQLLAVRQFFRWRRARVRFAYLAGLVDRKSDWVNL
jgi:hypothetical protein